MTGSSEVTPTAKVPVGVTTITGYSTSLVLFLLAVYAYSAGDRSEQTLGTLAAGGAAALTFLATQVGRYVQAKEQVKQTGEVTAARAYQASTASNPVTVGVAPASATYTTGNTFTATVAQNPGQEFDPDPEPPTEANPKAARAVLDRTER